MPGGLMKAAVHTKYGPPEVVQVRDVPQPVPGEGELLVRVHATTVNRTDAATRSATPPPARLVTGLFKPRATVLGCEFAGEVAAVGPGVTWFDEGQRVFGYVEGPFGAHAEYLVVPQNRSVATIPDNVDYATAAAATEGAHYALLSLQDAGIGPGSSVLVYGATGAIGSASVQLAKAAGASVTAVCEGRHIDLVSGLGADRCLDYTVEDFAAVEQRNDRVYDLVHDAVGKVTFGHCKPLLTDHGCFVSSELGPWAQNLFFAIGGRFTKGRRVLFSVPKHDRKMIEYFAGLLESGEFRPLIDRHYRLDDIVDAYRYVGSGQKLGNVIIDVVPPGDQGT